MKLEKLSPAQEAKMLVIRDFWMDYIFSCKNSEINKNAAKIGVDWMYKLAGYKEPIVIYVDSPLACQYAVAYLREFAKQIEKISGSATVRATVGDTVRATVWDTVGATVWATVGATVRDTVWATVRATVGDTVWATVMATVRDTVGDTVRATVWDTVRATVRDTVWDTVWATVGATVRDTVWAQKIKFESFASYGSIRDYGWVSFYDFFTQIGVLNHKGFEEFKNILLSGVYDMIQLNGFCIVSSLPKKIERDIQTKLHSSDGPAIVFNDGYEQYYWHGVSVPKEWILTPLSITKETVYAEKNAEKRRCIMEIVGESHYAELLDLITIETDEYNGQEVLLLKTAKKDEIAGEYIYFIKVICNSTSRNYYLCVSKEAFDLGALGALAWTFGLNKDDYQCLIET